MKLLNLFRLALTVQISHAFAASGTPGVRADLDKQYRINFGTTDTGGCQGFENLLRDSYVDAFQTAGTAIDALKIIRKVRPDATDAVGFAKWGRIARVFSALFGAGEETFRVRKGKGFNAVDHVSDRFLAMQADIARNILLGGPFASNPPASIYCSDTWTQQLRPTDIDPLDTQTPKRPLSVTNPKFLAGAEFSIPDQKLGQKKFPNFNPPCGPGNLAFTVQGFSAITFCPDTLNMKTSVTASIVDRKSAIQANDPIGNHRTMAEMWIHEWDHLLSSGSDVNAVDATGAQIFDANNNPVTAYGWDHTVNLAKNNPDAAQNLPDAYAIFANSMFYDNFDWSNGHAVAFTV